MTKVTFTVTINETGQQMGASMWIIVIEEIECISELHEGTNNQGDGGTQDGMIYGKEYEFRIKKYRDDSLPSEDMKKKIIWEYSYKNDNDEVIINTIESSGETFKLKIDNLEMLGKEISICAYLGKQRRDGKLDVFCHNRFRYFDREKIKNELNKRKKYPELANQSQTPTCGMASIFYILAKKDFNTYKKFILDLHRTGVAKCNSYNVDVSNSKHLLKMSHGLQIKRRSINHL
jgi:hypothetical protein